MLCLFSFFLCIVCLEQGSLPNKLSVTSREITVMCQRRTYVRTMYVATYPNRQRTPPGMHQQNVQCTGHYVKYTHQRLNLRVLYMKLEVKG